MKKPTFKTHWCALTPSQKLDLAERLSTSRAYLSQLAYGHRNPSSRFAVLLRLYTGRELTF